MVIFNHAGGRASETKAKAAPKETEERMSAESVPAEPVEYRITRISAGSIGF